MKLFVVASLVAMTALAPLASAQDWKRNHGRDSHRSQQHYPKGWGPHRGPDRGGYYHGYRGYRDHRPGYRRGKDGMWYPAAAFALGAIIGGALNQ